LTWGLTPGFIFVAHSASWRCLMKTRMTSKHWIGVAAAVCAACCAVPLGAVMGIGGAVMGSFALFASAHSETILCISVSGIVLSTTVYSLIRQRRQAKKRCTTSCRTDAGCCS
jgi:hypothetical protein